MPPRSRFTMLANDRGLPEPILKVLVKQGEQTASGSIPGSDLWRLPDLSACSNQPPVQVIVLAPDKSFVKHAHEFESRLAPAAIRHGFNKAFVYGIVELRSATGKSGVVGERDGLRQISIRTSQRWSGYIACARFVQYLQAIAKIVGRIFTVSIHSNDDFTPDLADGSIESRGHDFFGVVEDAQGRKCPSILIQNLTSTIVAHAVGDQDFHIHSCKVLMDDRIEKTTDEPDFIPARNNDRYLNAFTFQQGHGSRDRWNGIR